MKVIQIGAFFHPSVGGVERQMEEIGANLAKRGVQVEVFTTSATHGSASRNQRRNETYRGMYVRRFPVLLPLGHFFRWSPSLTWRLFRSNFDIAHVHNIHDGHMLPTIVVCLLKRKKLVVTGHNPYIVTTEKRGYLLNSFVKFYDFVLRILSFKIDRYIALINSEADAAKTKLGLKSENVVVIPNGIQDDFYMDNGNADNFYRQWNIDPDKWQLVVGTVSRINYVKGIHHLQQAVKENPDVLFVFAGGDDGYLRKLKQLYRLENNVIFTEKYLNSKQVSDFYQAIDIFLLPSVYEPFGMTIVEALAQGKFVLATNAGGPKEILTADCGEIIDPKDAEQWSSRIKYWSQNRSLLHQKQTGCQSVASKYRWDQVIDQILNTYNSLL